MENEKFKKERTFRCLKYFLIGQLLNLPVAMFMYPAILMWVGVNGWNSCNGYLWHEWESSSFLTLVLVIMVLISQVAGFCYWLKKLGKIGEQNIKSAVLRKLPFLFIGLFLAIFFMFLDFSPRAKERAIEYQQWNEEITASKNIFQEHLKQLPEDVNDQALGAYLLTFNEGEAFADYLINTSDPLYADKWSALHLNKDENAVLNYFHRLNPSMTSEQQNRLALNLYHELDHSFVRNLNGMWNYGLPFTTENSSLCEHILGFEVSYFEFMLDDYYSEEIDASVLASSLKATIHRLEQAKTLPDLHQEEIATLERHQLFYMECLAQLDDGVESLSLREQLTEHHKKEALETYRLQPYVTIIDHLIN